MGFLLLISHIILKMPFIIFKGTLLFQIQRESQIFHSFKSRSSTFSSVSKCLLTQKFEIFEKNQHQKISERVKNSKNFDFLKFLNFQKVLKVQKCPKCFISDSETFDFKEQTLENDFYIKQKIFFVRKLSKISSTNGSTKYSEEKLNTQSPYRRTRKCYELSEVTK